MTALADFYQLLENHDWFWAMAEPRASDAYNKGRDERRRIDAIAKESLQHAMLFMLYRDYIFKSRPKPPAPRIAEGNQS